MTIQRRDNFLKHSRLADVTLLFFENIAGMREKLYQYNSRKNYVTQT